MFYARFVGFNETLGIVNQHPWGQSLVTGTPKHHPRLVMSLWRKALNLSPYMAESAVHLSIYGICTHEIPRRSSPFDSAVPVCSPGSSPQRKSCPFCREIRKTRSLKAILSGSRHRPPQLTLLLQPPPTRHRLRQKTHRTLVVVVVADAFLFLFHVLTTPTRRRNPE